MSSTVIWIGPQDGDACPIEVRTAEKTYGGRFPATVFDSLRALDLNSDKTTEAAVVRAGGDLYDALQSAIGVDLGPLLEGDGVVLDIEADGVRHEPWEVLRARPNGRMIFADRTCPAVRGSLPYAPAPSNIPTPLHVLVVIGDPTDSRINAQQEIDAVYAGVCELPACWQVDVLSGPSAPDLKAAVAEIKPHVLHFIGHGVIEDGAPALGVVNPVKGKWPLTAGVVVNALRGAQPPRLVVLNACRTAGGAGRPDAWGVAEAFLDIGAGAVVTMQGDVASEAAVVFSESLYRSLVRGMPLHEAVAEARNDMAFDDRLQPRDWAIPVLTARLDPACVLTAVRHLEPDDAVRREPKVFDDVRWMVDRGAERRRLLNWLEGDGADAGVGVVGVRGGESVGKSLIALACVLVGRMRGMPVAYVDLRRRRGHLDWVEFMTALVDATVTGVGTAAEDPAKRFLEQVLPDTLVDRTHDLHVEEFPPADIVRLAHEYCVRIKRRDDYRAARCDDAVWKEFVDAILGWAEERSGGDVVVSPGDLRLMEKLHTWRVRTR